MAVPWFVCCLFLIAAALAVFVVRRRSNRRGESREPACGQCGYAVRGLPTFTCPECGSDLREVGIVTPQGPRPTSKLFLIILWSFLVLFIGVMMTRAIGSALPRRKVSHASFRLSEPRSGAYRFVNVNVDQSARAASGMPPQEGQAAFDLETLSGSTLRLEVDLPEMGYRYTKPNGERARGESGLSIDHLLEWMRGAGIDVASDEVRVEAAQLMSVAGAAARGDARFAAAGQPGFGSMSPGTSIARVTRSAPWFEGTALVFWLIVWVLGAWRILRRGRSRASA